MKHKDLLGREISNGDFIVYTSQSAGLRIALVVQEKADGWTGVYTYVSKKVRVVSLDYRDLNRANQSTATPEVGTIIINNQIPKEYKKILRTRAKELGYE